MKKQLFSLLSMVLMTACVFKSSSFISGYSIIVSRCTDANGDLCGPIVDIGDQYLAVRDDANPAYNDDWSVKWDQLDFDKLNMNGPSIIYYNDPVHGEGYYMFFAHHEGRSIRVIKSLTGGPWFTTWQVIKSPVLDAETNNISYFNNGDNALYNNKIQERLDIHVASPDVHYNDGNFYMYVHGNADSCDFIQKSLLLMGNGMNDLQGQGQAFGDPYLRLFQVNHQYYAVTKNDTLSMGVIKKNDDNDITNNFTYKFIFQHNLRHSAVWVDPIQRDGTSRVLIFFSEQGDIPERIKFVEMNTNNEDNPDKWKLSFAKEVMRPEYDWEGCGLNTGPSEIGAVYYDAEELRDPAVFVDNSGNSTYNGRIFLYYTVKGEHGIACAELAITY